MDHPLVSWSSKYELCSVFPDSLMKQNQNRHKIAHRNSNDDVVGFFAGGKSDFSPFSITKIICMRVGLI